jgi:hypothetical protein
MPAAMKAAVTSRVFLVSSAGSCQTVIACMSTTQKMHSYPIAHRAQIIAKMQGMGRLDAGKDAALHDPRFPMGVTQ